LANKICEGVGGAKSTIGVKNFNFGRNECGKRGEIGVNQSFIYLHPFSPFSSNFFILPSSTL
jgi:hypothetical protein